ncbi:MAG: hypothetical protein RLZ04_1717 [Actinomycetota bacterium]
MSETDPSLPTLRRNTAVVTVCTLVSRISGFGRVLATAAVLGSGLLGDVYQTANLIPNLLFELVAGGVLQAALVPAFVAARRSRGVAGLTEAVRAVAGAVGLVLAGVAVVGMLLSPLLARLMVASDPEPLVRADKLDVMVPMVLVFVPQLLFYGIATVTSAALNARGRYVAAALAPAVNNSIVIVACLWFRHARDGAVADLDVTTGEFLVIAGGTTLGVIAFSAVPALALRRVGVRLWPTFELGHPAVAAMRSAFRWATISVVGTFVPMAAALALGNGAPGGVAVFVYAFAFFVLPHALVAVPAATTLAPLVAEAWQDGDSEGLRRAVGSTMTMVVPLLALGGAGMVALGWPVARVAAFGQTASQGLTPIAHAFTAFGPCLIGYGVAFVLTRVLFSIGEVRTAAVLQIWAAAAGVAVMVVLSQVIDRTDRAAALAIGYGAAQTVAAIAMAVEVHRRTGALAIGRTAVLLVQSLVAAAASSIVMLLIECQFDDSRRQSLVALLLAGSVGVGVFGAVMLAMRPDLRRRALGRRRG